MSKNSPRKLKQKTPTTWTRSDRISLVAIIVAVVSAAFTGWGIYDQNQKWRATDAGAIVIEDVSFYTYKRFKEAEFHPADFGDLACDWDLSKDECLLRHMLIAVDKTTGSDIPGVTGVTIREITSRLAVSGLNADSVTFKKRYQLDIKYKNIGRTSVTDFKIRMETGPGLGADHIDRGGRVGEISSGIARYSTFFLTMDIGAPPPNSFSFRLFVQYTVYGHVVERIIKFTYSNLTGGFAES